MSTVAAVVTSGTVVLAILGVGFGLLFAAFMCGLAFIVLRKLMAKWEIDR